MDLTAIYANVSCSGLGRSTAWFEALMGRSPDAAPMKGLVEWHHGREGGLQLFENPAGAGHGTLTLIVGAVRDEHARLTEAGLAPGPVETADYTTIVRLRDPDSNLVVLAQPGRA